MAYVDWKGNRIFYLSVSPEKYESTVVCIHGAGGNCRHWTYQLGVASHLKCQIIALDLPGHGHSQGEPLQSITHYSHFVEDFIKLMKLEQPILAGHSMGGAIAMELAQRQPSMVSKLILIGTGTKFKVASWLTENLAKGIMPASFIRMAYADSADPLLIEQAIREAQKVPVSVYSTDFLACNSFALPQNRGTLNMPCLLVFGAEDRLTPAKMMDSLTKMCPRHRKAIIPQTGHMVMIENPDALNGLLQNFLLPKTGQSEAQA